MKNVYTAPQAVLRIFLSALFVSGTAWGVFFAYHAFWNFRAENEKYQIVAIVQTGPEREALQTSFLAEILGLSSDRPFNLYRLSLFEAKKRLLSFPLIKEASLKRIPPGTLYIDYAIRKPAAFLGERSNAAIDREGVIIPFSPFFLPKKLPQFYLGIDPKNDLSYGERIESEAIDMAWTVADYIKERTAFRVKSVDLSRAYKESLGARRIIVLLEPLERNVEPIEIALILNAATPLEGVDRFLAFVQARNDQMLGRTVLLDLRIPGVGIFQSEVGRL